MIDTITVYDADGLIVGYHTIPVGPVDPLLVPDGGGWYVGRVSSDCYFHEGEPVEKTEMAITVDGNVLTGIPAGAWAIVNNDRREGTIDDGELILSVTGPQIVDVVLQHPKWLLWHGEINCVPA